jgi:D-beta-D-heptose 7-phosphate kinase/D-beta-D-heptose 1-phosphate adenosyltransferase
MMATVIEDWKALEAALNEQRSAGKKIVSTNGVFDIVHIGHVRYLRSARELGDCLVVGVNSDACARTLKGPSRPFVSQADRMEMLAAFECVDFVTVFDEPTPERLLDTIKPDVHAKGGDYHPALLPESEVVQRHGGKVVILPFEDGYSTTSITERISAVLSRRA